MRSQRLRIVVIGGGAAGFFGAITCSQNNPEHDITILEAGQQLLAKVRISGGGRCNVTHACFEPALLVQNYPRGGKALRGAFTRFQPRDTIAWFESQGVRLKAEADGRIFPITDNSETIVQCLIDAAIEAGIEIRTSASVQEITWINDHFEITLKSGGMLKCDRLLLATGSHPSGHKFAQHLGHSIEPSVPSLFTFNLKDSRLEELAGISVLSVKIKLPEAKLEQTGSILITHWGLSGPAVLKLSAWGARFLHSCRYQTSLIINWLPQFKGEELRQVLLAAKSEFAQKLITANCPVSLPRRLWQKLVMAVGVSEQQRWAEFSNQALNKLILELTQGNYHIQGKGIFKEEFVTCGGVSLKEVDFKAMQSKINPHLYFAGEVLDIDGVTGGFNFQSAWTTGYLAGLAMAG